MAECLAVTVITIDLLESIIYNIFQIFLLWWHCLAICIVLAFADTEINQILMITLLDIEFWEEGGLVGLK